MELDLMNRYINDYKIPIQNNVTKDMFNYYIHLYEEELGTLTQYMNLMSIIEKEYNGRIDKFIKNYYQVREKVINYFKSNYYYISFNNMNIDKYSKILLDYSKKYVIKNKSTKSIYNILNNDKFFLSIDLNKANFQALKTFDKEIVKDCDTYEDFISTFTNSEYIKNSKYFRQVVFGQANPKRHIMFEKQMIYKIIDLVIEKYNFFTIEDIFSISNDELVFNISEDFDVNQCSVINDNIKKELYYDVKVKPFKIKGFNLYTEKDVKVTDFYRKDYLNEDKSTYHCIPVIYHAIIYKLMHNMELEDMDYKFIYDNHILSTFNEKFYIK